MSVKHLSLKKQKIMQLALKITTNKRKKQQHYPYPHPTVAPLYISRNVLYVC